MYDLAVDGFSEIKPPKGGSGVSKSCDHKYILIHTTHICYTNQTEDLFYCERCLDYQKRIR